VAEVTGGERDFRHTRARPLPRYNAFEMRTERWLTVAGCGTWLVSAMPAFFAIADGRIRPPASLFFIAAFITFGVAFGLIVTCALTRLLQLAMLMLQAIAGLAMVAASGDVFPAAALVVVAGQLDEVPPRIAALWIAVQAVALAMIVWWFAPPIFALTIAGSFAGFMVFALTTASLTARERRAREELATVNRELHATRALLAETSRVEERLRISRDLHDSLGHHLTALSLRLDVASRLMEGPAGEHVTQAYALTRLLLSDVRDVVGQLRETGRVDLINAIRALAAAAQGLTVHVEAPDSLEITDSARAHALLRSVQEIITNTTRHAGARNLWIRVESRRDGVLLHARDDGRGAGAIREGHGLTGMRERFEEHAGHVEFTAREGTGFEVHGFMPTPQAAS
jgi:signal transduction histidine kinase